MSIVQKVTRPAYYAPAAGRHYFSKAAAYNNEAKARFFARCDCEDDYESGPMPCDLHWPDGRYTKRREDGTTLTGRIIRRWAKLLAAKDRSEASAHPKGGE